MHIAFIHPSYPSAEGTGATHSATQVVRGLSESGHDVDVYCPQKPDQGKSVSNFDIHHLSGHSSHPHTNTRLNREVTARRNEFEDYDIVHSYLMSLIPSIAKLGQEFDIGTVVTLNAYGGVCAKNDLLYKNQKHCKQKSDSKCLNCIAQTGLSSGVNGYLYKKASQIFSLRLINSGEENIKYIDKFRAPSNHVKENYKNFGYDSEKISVIPHPVDMEFVIPHESDFIEPYNLLYVGSLDHHKGVQKLAPIMASLAESSHEFRLTIVGEGGLKDQLREQVNELDVKDLVEFTGFVPNGELPDVYAAHDCFVYPGIWEEPLARVYLESFATGTPVVTTDYGSIAQIVGDAGRVTDGTPSGFRDVLLDIVAKDDFNAMSYAAKSRVPEFELSKTINGIEAMYEDIDSRDREQPAAR